MKALETSDRQQRPLPQLPHGEGSMSWHTSGKIIYRKTIQIGRQRKRLSVYASSPKEAIGLMRKKEAKTRSTWISPDQQTLGSAIEQWMSLYKQAELKPASYDRLLITYTHQIKSMSISKIRWVQVTSDDLQQAISDLAQKDLSWSTIKKAYDLYSAFFAYKVREQEIDRSPMLDVNMPKPETLVKQTKKFQYLKGDEIDIFCDEALSLTRFSQVQKLKYYYGPAFVFLIYTGMRIGELCALQWSDVDFKKKTITVSKTVEEILNRNYDPGNPELMKKKGITKYTIHIGSTKNSSTRIIALNQKAYSMLLMMYSFTPYQAPEDYVIATKTRRPNTPRQMDQRLKCIIRNSHLSYDKCGCHMLRHTCASLMFEKGLQVELIASILGHSPEVCRRTYIHFCQEQKAEALHKISEFEI